MHSIAHFTWPTGQKNVTKVDLSENWFDTAGPIIRPRGFPHENQTRHPLHSQTDATFSHQAFPRSRRHPTHRFKQFSLSSGTLSKHEQTVVHMVKPFLSVKASKSKSSPSPHPPEPVIDTPPPSVKNENQRLKSREGRTFIGTKCAVCELSLEHKLSGEKVIQFSCGHVAHEDCLVEFMKGEEEPLCPECNDPLEVDNSRGSNLFDLNKLSSTLRSMSLQPSDAPPAQPSANLEKNWDGSVSKSDGDNQRQSSASNHDSIHDDNGRTAKLASGIAQSRHQSESSNSQLSQPSELAPPSKETPVKTHEPDLDMVALENKLKHIDMTKNIPRPKVTIRSEFPTLTRSNQRQSLTCLVTVEVPATRTRLRQIGGQHPLSTRMLLTESPQMLEGISTDLIARVENWHGLETDKFGPLRLHANLKVGRDGTNWQKLDCFLFSDLLICVREQTASRPLSGTGKPGYQLKGSILVREHLQDVEPASDDLILTLNLKVANLPTVRLKFTSREQLDVWRLALLRLDIVAPNLYPPQLDHDTSDTEEDDFNRSYTRPSSVGSIIAAQMPPLLPQANNTGYDNASTPIPLGMHVPIDVVVVIPLSTAAQGLKVKLLKDALRFIITHLGEQDRMGLVTYGTNGGAIPLVGMANKDWYGWREVYRSIKPTGPKNFKADAVEGANVAMDLLSQRERANPITSVLLISDSSTNETESVDYVVKRAHTIKASIFSLGLGQTHKPDNLIELASRTDASYTYVKDWMMLRECVAGLLGSLQSVSHIGAKLKLKIPEGSIAKFVRINGALHTKRPNGRNAEATLGDLRFGDKRDILVQLSIESDPSLNDGGPHDHWESIVSGLENLGGPAEESEPRPQSVEELPLIQADLSYGDLARGGATTHLSHPSLLTITVLPENPKAKRSSRGSIIPPVPSHPSIVQRRMEMLASDMLTRALILASKGSNDNAYTLLSETRTILQGLGKGNLPALPPTAALKKSHIRSSSVPKQSSHASQKSTTTSQGTSPSASPMPSQASTQPNSGRSSPMAPEDRKSEKRKSNASLPPNFTAPVPRSSASIDPRALHALDADIEACIEFIKHPTVFSHDARKAAFQAIGVISSQRGYTFRTETESYWAGRIKGVQRMGDITKDWQMVGNDTLTEEY